MSAHPHTKDKSKRVKPVANLNILWIGLGSIVVLLEWGFVINGPVGEPTAIKGSISQRCIPRGRQSNILTCTVQLNDGSVQVFTSLYPVEPGTPVSFSRYDRRFFGKSYEAESY